MSEEVNRANLYLKKRLNELAGMFKESRSGSIHSLERIRARFCLQEGVQVKTAQRYIRTLVSAGLLVLYSGGKGWRYNRDAEWELFQVPVDKRSRRR